MTGRDNDVRRPSGLVTGSLIGLSFGTVFVMVNSGDLPDPWPTVIRAAAVVTAAALLFWMFRVVRSAGSAAGSDDVQGFAHRAYWYAVVGEVIALFGGLYVINQVLDKPDVAVAWVALVVGVHFAPLAWAWRMPFYYWLAALMAALGLGGLLAYAAGASAGTVALIAGVGSGFALYGAVAAGLRYAQRRAASIV
ncbi:hypothetical protein ACWT_2779 [Actinoplanes sp. SE50]|uniref:hypothetical protein n=1 Tax=unclassified Actinoplanes TaxID=2626549 RepID=UPI00023EC784|nr:MULTISPECIES: hypothetical protein [unclassified Actinoplanes]AEV83662.1 hypothetical protein ACPL_2767 [Actinoplanes sp. SE50/110]ATO82194.1 hypothetical protein ACWT_2779 [Actinoplanes sp. SE50]SLL99601.1 hypothetical protein ACSP50_2832 [Actinoplanes sp. SE50/110]